MTPEERDAVLAEGKRFLAAWRKIKEDTRDPIKRLHVALDLGIWADANADAILSAVLRERENAKDAARLDWLESHPREGTIRIGTDMKPCIFWGMSSAPGFTLRAAIDAAIAAEGREK